MHHPADQTKSDGRGIVFLHAFAEEMNKSRHVVAQASRGLASMGIGVLLIDLRGCGDSPGNFDDASWEDWQDDVSTAIDWMRARQYRQLALWGARTGALLAAEAAAARPDDIERCALWQPTLSGDTYLTQFLRLRVANAMLTGAKEPETTRGLRARLESGETIEVAGYGLSPRMAAALADRRLEQARPRCPVDWFEVVPEQGAEAALATQRVVAAWQAQQAQVQLHTVACEPFWGASSTAELVQCPGLVNAMVDVARTWR